VVKYRKPLLIRYGQRLKELLQQIVAGSDFAIQERKADRDHASLMILNQPKLTPAQIVRRLKAESTHLIWLEHPELKREFWNKHLFWGMAIFGFPLVTPLLKPSSNILSLKGESVNYKAAEHGPSSHRCKATDGFSDRRFYKSYSVIKPVPV